MTSEWTPVQLAGHDQLRVRARRALEGYTDVHRVQREAEGPDLAFVHTVLTLMQEDHSVLLAMALTVLLEERAAEQ